MAPVRGMRSFAAYLLSSSICVFLVPSQIARAQSVELPETRSVDENGVDLINGSFIFNFTEGSIGDSNGGVALTRSWASEVGWVDNWVGGLLLGSSEHRISIGSISERFQVYGGQYLPFRPNGSTLVELSGGGWRYTSRDGLQIDFMDGGTNGVYRGSKGCSLDFLPGCVVPTKVRRPDGMLFTLAWDSQITCHWNWSTTCGNGYESLRLRSVTSSANYQLTFLYVDNGVPISTDPPSTNWFKRASAQFQNLAAPIGSPPTISYAYPAADVTDITLPDGATWKLTAGSQTRIRRPGESADSTVVSYNTNGVSSTVIDGVTTTYSRTITPISEWEGYATIIKTDALSQSTTYQSDLHLGGIYSITDANSQVTSIINDGWGRPERVSYPEGNYIEYSRDDRGNITQTRRRDKTGNAANDIVTSATYAPSCDANVACNEPLSTTDGLGHTTDYTYDPSHGGVLTRTTPAATAGTPRPQTRYTYSTQTAVAGQPVHLLTGVSDCQTAPSCDATADETKSTFTYTLGNLLPTVATTQNGTGTLAASTTLNYDATGNLTSSDGPLPGPDDTTIFRYDAARRRVGVVSPDPDGSGSLKRRAQRVTYDLAGHVVAVEQGAVAGTSDGDWSAFTAGSALSSTWTNGRISANVVSSGSTTYSVTQFSYDILGRRDCEALRMNPSAWSSLPTSACSLGTTGVDGPDRISKYSYDVLDRVSKVQSAYETADQADHQTLTYSANGKLIGMVDAEANKTTYTYDGHDRLWQTFYPAVATGSGTSSGSDYEQLTYDAAGNVISRRLRDGQFVYLGYDALNRLTSRNRPNAAWQETDHAYSYDLLGRMSAAWDSNGHVLSFTYDALSRRLSEVSNWHGAMSSTYDLAGRRTQLSWPDNFYVTYDYLVTGEMTAIRELGAASGSGLLATFDYDDLGRRISLARGNGTSTSYSYDGISRTASITHDNAGTNYDVGTIFNYNPASQISSRASDNSAYAWNEHYNIDRFYTNNGLNQVQTAGSTNIGHDARGNVTSSGADTYSYTASNELAQYNGTANFAYDPMGRLFHRSAGDTVMIYDGLDAVLERVGGGVIGRRFVHGPNIDEPLVEYSGAGTDNKTWLHADERGSIVARSDMSGEVPNNGINTYDEYGIPGPGNVGLFQYTGQIWIAEAGLQYSKARIYSATLGRFLQPDPVGYSGGPNLYGYVNADPINLNDPLGLTPQDSTTYGDDIVVTWHLGGDNLAGTGGASSSGRSEDCSLSFADVTADRCAAGIGGMPQNNVRGTIGRVLARGTLRLLRGLGVISRTKIVISTKIRNQMKQRGWTEQDVREAVDAGRTGVSQGNINAAVVYGSKHGHVVVDRVTGDVIQVSHRNKPWVPDARIIWD